MTVTPATGSDGRLLREIAWRDPVAAFRPVAAEPFAMLLHTGAAADEAGANHRWSFVAALPTATLSCRSGRTQIDGAIVESSPFDALIRLHRARRNTLGGISPPPFLSGLCGFVGYESGAILESTARGHETPYGLPDFAFGAYDAIAAFDRRARRAYISGLNERAVDALAERLGGPVAGDTAPGDLRAPSQFSKAESNFTRNAYEQAVANVIARIRAGDLFQANIAQILSVERNAPFDALALFERAAARSSAPFGAFASHGDAAILCLSPERFFKVAHEDGKRRITAEPIKGTRPRGKNPDEDRALLAALIADPKDRAENIMIADLVRNDLSRVCADHSIREEAICTPATHTNVHHLVSRISGVLREDECAASALAALFPCGSITGAPKIEAMRVIASLEPEGRGPYCGAIGYIDDTGAADFAVAIRLAIAERGRISIPVGGGVTLKSDPAAEYDETIVKARGWFDALAAGSVAS